MNTQIKSFIAIFSFLTVYLTIVFVFNNILTVYLGWPGIEALLKPFKSLSTTQIILSSLQWMSYILIVAYCFYSGYKINNSKILDYSKTFSNFSRDFLRPRMKEFKTLTFLILYFLGLCRNLGRYNIKINLS